MGRGTVAVDARRHRNGADVGADHEVHQPPPDGVPGADGHAGVAQDLGQPGRPLVGRGSALGGRHGSVGPPQVVGQEAGRWVIDRSQHHEAPSGPGHQHVEQVGGLELRRPLDRDEAGHVVGRAVGQIPVFIRNGSPLSTTERSGPTQAMGAAPCPETS